MDKKVRNMCFNSDIIMRQVGEHFKKAREARLFQLEQLADASGYSSSEVRALEGGYAKNLNIHMIIDLCAVIGYDWTSMFYFDREERKEWKTF